MRYTTLLLVLSLSLATAQRVSAKKYASSTDRGDSTMRASFVLPLGESITAVGSAVGCDLDIDTAKGKATGTCRVALTSITVDAKPQKTEHFYQWATNKKSKAAECVLELQISATTKGPPQTNKAVSFETHGAFKICGRSHDKGTKEKIKGEVVLIPAGEYAPGSTTRVEKQTVLISARIEKFNREAYHIGPDWTSGWLAKVQRLANVVAEEGTIELRIFASAK